MNKKTIKNIIIILSVLIIIMPLFFLFVLKNDANVDMDHNSNVKQNYDVETKYTNIFISYIPIRVQTIPRVENITLGIDTGTEEINIGVISANTPVRKKLDFANNEDVSIKVIMTIEGNISEYIVIDRNKFIIYPKETESQIINFVGAPENLNLSGTIIVKLIVPKYPSLLWVY